MLGGSSAPIRSADLLFLVPIHASHGTVQCISNAKQNFHAMLGDAVFGPLEWIARLHMCKSIAPSSIQIVRHDRPQEHCALLTKSTPSAFLKLLRSLGYSVLSGGLCSPRFSMRDTVHIGHHEKVHKLHAC